MNAATLLIIAVAGTGAGVTLDALASSVAAQGDVETFQGMLYGCSSTNPPADRLTPGGVLHFEGGSNVNLWVTDHPLASGLERNIVDAHINFNHGIGRAHAVATLTPEGVEGFWDIRFHVRVGGGGAHGNGAGRGALEGRRIDFDVEPRPGAGPNLCTEGFPFLAAVTGTIRSNATAASLP